MKYHIEKDGWRVYIFEGKPVWVESEITYTERCRICSGHGYVPNRQCKCKDNYGWGCDCKVRCVCEIIHGVGRTRDKPKHQPPSQDILDKLGEILSNEMKVFGILLDAGYVEDEIIKEKALNDSLKGANL